MKKFVLVWFIIFFSCSANAQYFDWNRTFHAMSCDFPGDANYTKHLISGNGSQIIGLWERSCLFCDPEFYEYLIDSNGNTIVSYYVPVGASSVTHLFFDHNNHYIELLNSTYLTYHLANPLSLTLSGTTDESFIDADTLNNLYVFDNYPTFDVQIFDSTGLPLDSFGLAGDYPAINDAGEIYTYSAGWVNKYNNSGVLLHQYPSTTTDYIVAKKSGKVWLHYPSQVICYDSSGNVNYTIPIAFNSIAADPQDNLFAWGNQYIYKYINDSLVWTAYVNCSGPNHIGADNYGNMYYLNSYQEPNYEGGFNPGSYSIPPSVAYIGCDQDPAVNGQYPGQIFAFITGKINKDTITAFTPSVACVVDNLYNPVTSFCTATPFYVLVNYDHLPVGNSAWQVSYIELSDSSGSFANPITIGHSSSLFVGCSVPSTVPTGNGYLIRARYGTTNFSVPYGQSFNIRQTPQATMYIDNSFYGMACAPFILKANTGLGLVYYWHGSYENGGTYYIDDIGVGSAIVLYDLWYDDVWVEEYRAGCSSESNSITPSYYELDTTINYPILIAMPDTVNTNDPPFSISPAGYAAYIYGPGIYYDSTNGYLFYPDSVLPGLITDTAEAVHSGIPCIPYLGTRSIYVDSTLLNINTLDVEPSDRLICREDTFYVPFTLLDSAIYDSSNVFTVEMVTYNTLSGATDVGAGTQSPIQCVAPTNQSGLKRFRIRASQTGEKSTLNTNGNITIPETPYANFSGNQNMLNFNCFPTNQSITLNSSKGQHQWFRNDTLIIDSIGKNIGIIPVSNGDYKLTLTDTSNGCITHLGPFEVNDSAHIPSLTILPVNWYLFACGKTYPQLIAHTDSFAAIQWFNNGLLLSSNDTIQTDTAGLYHVIVTSLSGCTISVHDSVSVVDNPIIQIDVPLSSSICPGDSALLSVQQEVYNGFYSYRWLKNDSIFISANRQTYVKDTGFYSVVVTSTILNQGCKDTSPDIHISYTNLQAPATTPSGTVVMPHGQTVTISTPVDSQYSYQWYRDNYPIINANQASYNVARYGTYKVRTSTSHNCFAFSDPVWVTKNPNISEVDKKGNDDNEVEPVFSLYPNPNNGNFYLQSENIKEANCEISIADVYGRCVYKSSITFSDHKNLNELNLKNIADGLYLIHLNTSQFKTFLSLIINK